MDPDYVDEEEEAAAMAAMMGFSGFGSQKPPAKKRKFTTDAFVEGQDIKALDKGGKNGQGSGGNQMPLGKARVFGFGAPVKFAEPLATNEAEIDLDDEDGTDGPQYVDTSLPPPILAGGQGGPSYTDMNTSVPPEGAVSDEEMKEMQLRIDAILESVQSQDPDRQQIPAPGTEAIHGLPQRPSFSPPNKMTDSDFMHGASRPGFDASDSRYAFSDTASIVSSRPSHRGGPRNEKWYLDYYDPSFNENPWEKLEKERGLEPLVKWGKAKGGLPKPR